MIMFTIEVLFAADGSWMEGVLLQVPQLRDV